ncbi:MAG: DUF2238 domain-containing protein [Candidatus Woesearchaeota archaeon]
MHVKKEFFPVMGFTILYVIIFSIVALLRRNYEFLVYIFVIGIIFFLVLAYLDKRFNQLSLWGLSIWGFLHMCGGNIFFSGIRLYDIQLIPVILRYDQLIHAFGFGVATFVAYQLLEPYLKDNIKKWKLLSFLIIMIGMGFGALNEVVELFAMLMYKNAGVGDYYNNAFDLVFNLIGAIIAILLINLSRIKSEREKDSGKVKKKIK